SYVGLLETGDMVFLFEKRSSTNNILNRIQDFDRLRLLKGELYWGNDQPNFWSLLVYSGNIETEDVTEFEFFVPEKIFKKWKEFNLDKKAALDIKQDFFSKIFVFNHNNNPIIPFSIINLNKDWLNDARERLNDSL
ncbi:MAG TPA: hypothetical protein VF455_05725, partial [Chryseobacterium sp.]